MRETEHPRPLGLGRPHAEATRGGGEQLLQGSLVDDLALADDRDPIAEVLHLAEQVAREEHGEPFAREPAHELTHVAHPGRVEPGRRLVEQQQLRLPQQRGGDPEALAHPVRVAADAVLGPVAQLDQLEHLLDPRTRASPSS